MCEVNLSLVHALMLSQLDNCNSILHSLPKVLLGKLQCVHNACARIILRCGKFDHVMPMLAKMDWLPIEQQIQFKILLLTCKCLHGKAPQYLHSQLMAYHLALPLRCSGGLLLWQPKAHTRTGERTFPFVAPLLWNRLPLGMCQCSSVQMFRTKLKTHFFQQQFRL